MQSSHVSVKVPNSWVRFGEPLLDEFLIDEEHLLGRRSLPTFDPFARCH
jgi:hypothetical protein